MGIHKKLFRRSSNQLGVLAIAAGLVAFFIDSGTGVNELKLIFSGLLLYIFSIIRWQPKPATDDTGG